MTTENSLDGLPDYLLAWTAGMRTDEPWMNTAADEIEKQVACWKAGRANLVPRCWLGYMEGFNKTRDPEYPEYLRLQEKFGDK